jgi:hypothetical protein
MYLSLSDLQIDGLPDWLTLSLHGVNIVLAAFATSMCFYHQHATHNSRQRARFLALGGMTLLFVWGSMFFLYAKINVRTPLYTVFLLLAIYGSLISFRPQVSPAVLVVPSADLAAPEPEPSSTPRTGQSDGSEPRLAPPAGHPPDSAASAAPQTRSDT